MFIVFDCFIVILPSIEMEFATSRYTFYDIAGSTLSQPISAMAFLNFFKLYVITAITGIVLYFFSLQFNLERLL
jgi:hypothetical protein